MEIDEVKYSHIPVMLNEAINGLNIKEDGIYVDCTLGGGGHSSEILRRLKNGMLICFDQDDYAISRGSQVLANVGSNWKAIRSNFSNVKEELEKLGISHVDGILYDLGVSSFQFDIKERGFSYNQEADLDMRMDTNQYLKAYDIVNFYGLEELKTIFYTYGEEKYSANIAKKIVKEREKKAIQTTTELAEIIKSAIPAFARRTGGHPAKKVFQALRIAVNDELHALEKSLNDALTLLNKGGRIVVISFQSLEDRIVKQTFRSVTEVKIPKGVPIKESEIKHEYKLVTNKALVASKEEVSANNRAHSAKLRIIEKL